MSITDFLQRLVWLDGQPLWPRIEPYRRRIFEQFFSRDALGALIVNLLLAGRGKKNDKTLDLVLAALYCVCSEPSPGYDADVSILANDRDQAGDDLSLAKKLIKANPLLAEWLHVKQNTIERRDGRGFLETLASGDAVDLHGKSRRLTCYDEIHGYRDWSVFEALQPDPNRRDTQQWITSYASLIHRPGAPLHDLMKIGKAGRDPRMLFSWYAADFCTDPDFAHLPPEQRANPSMASWNDPGYLEQQRLRLPSHLFRRLHLNLPGSPEGAALDAEMVMDSIERGVTFRECDAYLADVEAYVDMSGGSRDDATCALAGRDADDNLILLYIGDQGQRPPFDPHLAVQRFARIIRERYGCRWARSDRFAGETFRYDFHREGVTLLPSERTTSQNYEQFEVLLNAGRVTLLDHPKLEQQLLGLVWRGGKIDHPNGEHDDFACAAAGAIVSVGAPKSAISGLTF